MGFNDGYRRSLQGLIDGMGDAGVVLRWKVHLLYLRGAHCQLHTCIP